MPSIPDQAALKTTATWLPNSSNQQHQWDYRSMPMLACPELCQVTASMSNASAVGLWSSSTCNTLARQLTSELSPDLPAATNFSCPAGSLNNSTWTVQSPALQPSEASQLMSQLLGQHGMALAALAASLNYDCSMAALTFSAYPIHRLSSTDCGTVSSASVPALPCTDLCNAPLPYPFFYESVSAPNLINGSSVPPDAGTIPSGDHAELLARFAVACTGGVRTLTALGLQVTSFGDWALDVRKEFSTSNNPCCRATSPSPAALNGSASQNTSQRQLAQRLLEQPAASSLPVLIGGQQGSAVTSQLPLTSTVMNSTRRALLQGTQNQPLGGNSDCVWMGSWDLGQGFLLEAGNGLLLQPATSFASLSSPWQRVSSQHTSGRPSLQSLGSLGLGPGLLMLTSNGSCSQGGAQVSPPISPPGAAGTLRLTWVLTFTPPTPPLPPSSVLNPPPRPPGPVPLAPSYPPTPPPLSPSPSPLLTLPPSLSTFPHSEPPPPLQLQSPDPTHQPSPPPVLNPSWPPPSSHPPHPPPSSWHYPTPTPTPTPDLSPADPPPFGSPSPPPHMPHPPSLPPSLVPRPSPPTGQNTTSVEQGPSSTTALVGVAVGVSLGVTCLLTLAAFMLVRARLKATALTEGKGWPHAPGLSPLATRHSGSSSSNNGGHVWPSGSGAEGLPEGKATAAAQITVITGSKAEDDTAATGCSLMLDMAAADGKAGPCRLGPSGVQKAAADMDHSACKHAEQQQPSLATVSGVHPPLASSTSHEVRALSGEQLAAGASAPFLKDQQFSLHSWPVGPPNVTSSSWQAEGPQPLAAVSTGSYSRTSPSQGPEQRSSLHSPRPPQHAALLGSPQQTSQGGAPVEGDQLGRCLSGWHAWAHAPAKPTPGLSIPALQSGHMPTSAGLPRHLPNSNSQRSRRQGAMTPGSGRSSATSHLNIPAQRSSPPPTDPTLLWSSPRLDQAASLSEANSLVSLPTAQASACQAASVLAAPALGSMQHSGASKQGSSGLSSPRLSDAYAQLLYQQQQSLLSQARTGHSSLAVDPATAFGFQPRPQHMQQPHPLATAAATSPSPNPGLDRLGPSHNSATLAHTPPPASMPSLHHSPSSPPTAGAVALALPALDGEEQSCSARDEVDEHGAALFAAYLHLANNIMADEQAGVEGTVQGASSPVELCGSGGSGLARHMPMREDVVLGMVFDDIQFEQGANGGLLGVGSVGSVYRATYKVRGQQSCWQAAST
ncbi:hypothetical protein V8C86DRAFT_1599079 [Haematococcus lacustris]